MWRVGCRGPGHKIGIPAVGDKLRVQPEPGAEVLGGRPADADHGVGGSEPPALQPPVDAPLDGRREPGADRLEGPPVAQVRDPGDAPAPKDVAHEVHGFGRRAGDHAVEALAGAQAQGVAAGERCPGRHEGLRDDDAAQRMRAAGVRIGVEQRVHAVAAVKAGAEALEVARTHDILLLRRVARPIGRRRQHGHAVSQAAQPLGHRRGAMGAGVAARRVEVGDEEQVQAILRRRAARASE